MQEQAQFDIGQIIGQLSHKTLNPMQAKAVMEGVIDARKVLVCAPTASGKTLIAQLAMIKNFKETQKKSVYVVPLKALAQEKQTEFSGLFSQFGMKVESSTGDFDSDASELAIADVIIITIEKLDSLLRHKLPWLEKIGLAVVDEAHLLNDESRGATLEIVLVKLLDLNCKMLALSATIPNSDEISKWLNAQLFVSDYRPTKLVHAIASETKVTYYDKKSGELSSQKLLTKNTISELLRGVFDKKGQGLVFVSSRRFAESSAVENGPSTYICLTVEEKEKLEVLAQKVLKTFQTPTMQCKSLANCIRNGVAFHHAGIPSKQRTIIEEGYKNERAIKAIFATTTLAMGIDYPASIVIVKHLKRFTGAFSEFIPNFEVQQMCGRAGRPRYDKEGIAVLMCAPKDKEYVLDNYVYGAIEKIYSKLASAAILRMHCLGLLASEYCNSYESIYRFFERSLFAFQYGKTEELFEMIENVIFELKEMEFLVERKSGNLVATPLGRRVSELYIDPLSASEFVRFIKVKEPKSAFDYLFAINCATEMYPLVSIKRTEEMGLFAEVEHLEMGKYLESHYDERNFLERYKSAKLLEKWISEETEEAILEKFEIAPGILASRVRNAKWLAYSIAELAYMLNETNSYREGKKAMRRIKYGIKEELLDLCRTRGIGRVRARKLFGNGITTSEMYSKLSKSEVRDILRRI